MLPIEHLQNLLARKRREFARKFCLHPEAPSGCSKSIVAAHSIQRAIIRKHIAIKGHVVQIKTSAHVDPVGLLVKPEEIGINEATTFFGFCGIHDADLFRPLECSSFSFEPHQIALLGYRAVCRELYQKHAEITTANAVRDYLAENPDIVEFHEKNTRHNILQVARFNAHVNLTIARDDYASMLSDYAQLRYYAVKFKGPPVYLCSVAFLPEWDFEGNRLQDLSYVAEYKPLCFSAWAAGDSATVVFCWHKSADTICEPFIDSLRQIPRDRLANRILGMAFDVSDNVVFRSDWWESISEEDRQRIVSKVLSGVGEYARKADCLADDGLSAIGDMLLEEHVNYGHNISMKS